MIARAVTCSLFYRSRKELSAVTATASSSKTESAEPHTSSASPREITIAHSPDSDDAFMFYGLATNKIRVNGYKFTHTLCDIETLNQKAMNEAFYDVTAISFHAYPYIQDNFALLSCGCSVSACYVPMIFAIQRFSLSEIKKIKVAVP